MRTSTCVNEYPGLRGCGFERPRSGAPCSVQRQGPPCMRIGSDAGLHVERQTPASCVCMHVCARMCVCVRMCVRETGFSAGHINPIDLNSVKKNISSGHMDA
eukprot:1142382-Pelagomonas_calceolata.AAC.1